MDGGSAFLDSHCLSPAAHGVPELFHAPSSYCSMLARLALIENRIPFVSRPLDIHRGCEHHAPWYARINPGMTVPALRLHNRDLTDSREILMLAFGRRVEAMDDGARRWVDDLYAFPVDELTVSWLMGWNPLARRVLPRKLARMQASLRRSAEQVPDLAQAYSSRAAVLASRVASLAPAVSGDRFRSLKGKAISFLDRLDHQIADCGPPHAPDGYGPQDVLWTVFLARLQLCGLGREIGKRRHVKGYYRALRARPSFGQADIRQRLRLRELFDPIV